MRIVVALGGHAFPRRIEHAAHENDRQQIRAAARALADLARDHSLVVTHETDRLIEDQLRRELANLLGHDRITTLLTRTIVRGVQPADICELPAIRLLADNDFLVICASGYAPVRRAEAGALENLEGPLDNDLWSAVLARRLQADCLMLLTDVAALYADWQTDRPRRIRCAHPEALDPGDFPAGSTGVKIDAARDFAISTGRPAYIGALDQASELLDGSTGTCVKTGVNGFRFGTTLTKARPNAVAGCSAPRLLARPCCSASGNQSPPQSVPAAHKSLA